MPDKENATGGEPMAGGQSEHGNDAQPHDSTPSGESASDFTDNDDLLDEIDRLVEEATVIPPNQPYEPKPSDEDRAFLLSAGLSDEANAQCVKRLYAGRFARNEAFGWLNYTGTHWEMASAEQALERAIVRTLTLRIEVASQPETFESGAALRKFALPNRNRMEGAKALLKKEIVVEPQEFEHCPELLNCANGVVNLRTGKLIAHSPDQRFLYCVPVAYRPAADRSVWLAWLIDAVGDDQADWLQLAMGYSLTGHTKEETLFYLLGPSRAGKGVFVETIRAVLGSPLSAEIEFATFTGLRSGDSQNFDLAPLKPCRFLAASESNAYERFNEAKVKALTGGNSIYCSFKHREHFNYRPSFKIWLSSNQPINADSDDDAVWGRFVVIEFPHSHLGKEDKQLKDRMRERAILEGVLAWAVYGAVRWYGLGRKGLAEPAGSVALKAAMRNKLDTVGAWIEDCCTVESPYFAAFAALYASYSDWCKNNGVEPKRNRHFNQAMTHKGFREGRQRIDGKLFRGFYGLKL